MFGNASYSSIQHPLVFVILGCFITMSVFLAAMTCYYRKKVGILKQIQNIPVKKPEHKCKVHNKEDIRKQQRVSRSKQILVPKIRLLTFSELNNCNALPSAEEAFQERYDEHGVMVESKVCRY